MRKILFLPLLIVSLCADSIAATRPAARGTRGGTGGTSAGTTAPKTVNRGRAAVTAPAKTQTSTSGASAPKTVNRGRAATTTTTKGPTVAARAGVTQKVIGSGTKVAAAAKNVVVDQECQQKYDGCMDAFCMIDNASGGRCMCSDKNAEYDAILAEIEKLDQQSYQMATFGVERIEMGANADAAIAAANAAANSILKEGQNVASDGKKTSRRTLDLSMWDDVELDEGDENIFGASGSATPLGDAKGDALHAAAADMCAAQIPECSSEISMLKLLYSQRIKADCTAYENSLKQQKKSSQQKLQTAERALREAALDQLKTANKYDLGQCTIEFKKCMQTTGGCGNDFAGCAIAAAMDATNVVKSTSKNSKKQSTYQIKGAITNIEISASTYDNLMAKKPLCESITKQCVAVADQVWDTFLRDVAPQMKNAELIAEDNARQNCIGNISSCFQKACKDNIDPKDPDGSYDMCLTRPATMLNVCKVPLNACGIDASSEQAAEESDIWDYVLAALAAQRVDSCTTAVKECLTSDDRCGKDYTQCIGLDTDTIMRMCPYDKLTGCQKKYGETNISGNAVYEELANMVQGIMLNIDNSFLTACQNAANEAMVKVCGDTTNCNALTVDANVGTRSLEYKICEYSSAETGLDIDFNKCRTDISQISDEELGRNTAANNGGVLGPVTPLAGVIDGTIYWENIEIDDDGKVSTVEEYLTKIDGSGMSQKQKDKVKSELAQLQSSINMAIETIEADPTVQFCMTGREVQGMKKIGTDGQSTRTRLGEKSADAARFPELTKQMRSIIATAALKSAKDNYYKKYDELNEKLLTDYAKIGERMAKIRGENALDSRREIARDACVNFASASSMPKSAEPPKSAAGKIIAMTALVGAAIAIPIAGPLFTGTSITATAATATLTTGSSIGATAGIIGGGAAGVAGIGLAGNAGSGKANGEDNQLQKQLIGSKSTNNWNLKENVVATFEWETLNCHICTKTTKCSKEKNPPFGKKYCKTWADTVESCKDVQF